MVIILFQSQEEYQTNERGILLNVCFAQTWVEYEEVSERSTLIVLVSLLIALHSYRINLVFSMLTSKKDLPNAEPYLEPCKRFLGQINEKS